MTDLVLLLHTIKNDDVTKGIRVDDKAIEHLGHLLDLWKPSDVIQAMRFYVMGYAAGVQSRS